MLAERRMLAAVTFAALLAGCGATARPEGLVRLSLSAPTDGARVTTGSAVISGTVSPGGATVFVAGHSVPVSDGSFQTRVSLAPGQNIVDVLAGASQDRAAMTTVRVFRQVDVSVPSLSGQSVAAATAALRARGLTPRIVDNEPFYSFLLPGSPAVCNTAPAAGQAVTPGSVITVTVSKTC